MAPNNPTPDPSPPTQGVESVDTSSSMYYVPRRFAQNSKLHRYLAFKCPGFVNIRKKDYNLYEVLLALKKVISSEKLFDPQNPTVILCDDNLEDALEVKAIHVSEIKDQVNKQFFIIESPTQHQESLGGNIALSPPQNNQENASQTHAPSIVSPLTQAPNNVSVERTNQTETTAAPVTLANGDSFALPSWASTSANAVIARMNTSATFDIEGKYLVKAEFLKVLRSVEGVNQTQTVFHYREITSLLSQYIMTNKNKFFDLRNIRVALVENDPLGKAFGVKAFARSQVTSLLRAQLTPFEESDEPLKELQDNEHKPMEGIEITTGTSNVIAVRPDSSNNETLFSTQGYETSPAKMEAYSSSSESSNEESDDEKYSEENTYRVEFEVDNGTDDEREDVRKQDCSDEDSEIDDVKVSDQKSLSKSEDSDFGDWADSEFSEIGDSFDKLNFDLKLPSVSEVWRCLTCKEPNDPFMKYCAMCWKDRKTWIPSRAKPRRRRRTRIENGSKSPTSPKICDSESTLDHPMNEDKPESVTSSDSGFCSNSPSYSQEINSCSQEIDSCSQEIDSDLKELDSQMMDTQSVSRKRHQSSMSVLSLSDKTDLMEDSPMVKTRKVVTTIVNNYKVFAEVEHLELLQKPTPSSRICSICCINPKDACFIHGQCSHQVCCYPCAKKIFKNKETCPVCRRKIEKITRNFTY